MSKVRIGIFFDLDDLKLRKYYPNKYYTQAWADIKRFMENHGFIHQQYSGYVSKSYMQKSKAQEIVMELALKYSWLNKCLKECVMSTIGKEYNLKDYVNKLYENIEELDEDEIYFVEQEVEEEKDEMEL